jgi:hypothetical protein
LKFEIWTFSNGEVSVCVHRCRIRPLFWAAGGAWGRYEPSIPVKAEYLR